MDDFEFVDALTGDSVVQNYHTGELSVEKGGVPGAAESIFFPGCSIDQLRNALGAGGLRHASPA